MLAALAAGAGRASTSGLPLSSSSALSSMPLLDSAPPPPLQASSSTSVPTQPPAPIERRRSQRLKAKDEASSSSGEGSSNAQLLEQTGEALTSTARGVSEPAPSAGGETAPSDTVVNDEPDYGDFTDEEVDAEVPVLSSVSSVVLIVI